MATTQNKMKKLMTIYGLIIFAFSIFTSCGGGSNLRIGQTYTFFDGQNSSLQCYECDPIWCIKFTNENTCELWTRPNNSDLQSCKTDAKYSYDKNNQTITILSISNSNISNECLEKFIGEWQWKKGAFGERFYSKKYSDCDFS